MRWQNRAEGDAIGITAVCELLLNAKERVWARKVCGSALHDSDL
jgi:hypothetical protein